jgi:hypothetical protein
MDYEYFEIKKYKSISSPVRLSVKESITPIIGINECGKTTILKGIFAFDFSNDWLIKDQSHVLDVSNLNQSYDKEPAIIEAGITVDQKTLKDIVQKFNDNNAQKLSPECVRLILENCPKTLCIQRRLNGENRYPILGDIFENEADVTVNDLAKKIITFLPPIVYFDDFNESMPETIEFNDDLQNQESPWAEIVNNMFKATNPELPVSKLFQIKENNRKSTISDVNMLLDEAITQRWNGMKIGNDSDELKISIDCQKPDGLNITQIKFTATQRVLGKDRHFDVSQRSKGFYWFFNFVMKTSFHPKSQTREDKKIIFLFDEPGAYLHVSAQKELCSKLVNQPTECRVIYCTHSHNLLHPDYIKLSSIKICEKEADGNVRLFNISNYRGSSFYAFQPIYDSLGLSPQLLDSISQKIVITEGITDFYALQMFCNDYLSFFPSTGARNLEFIVPIFLSSKRQFICLFDADKEGSSAKKEMIGAYGEGSQLIIYSINDIDTSARFMEDFFDEGELKEALANLLVEGQELDKKRAIQQLFFHQNKKELIEGMKKTKQKFKNAQSFFERAFDAGKPHAFR